jgi:hypothetical protein
VTTLTRAPTVSGAEGGEHHIGDYKVTGHTRNGIIGDLKKRTIQRRAGTIGDYSDSSSNHAEGGEHHVGDYNAAGHTKNGIICDFKKRTIQRWAVTIGDYSD